MQFDRVCALEIGPAVGGAGLRYEGLRITFNIEKDVTVSQNKARVEIYNLSENSRAAIQEKDTQIRLFAGYAQDTGAKLIFAGTVSYASHATTPPDIITSLQVGDGLTALRDGRTTLGLQPGASVDQACLLLCQQVGLPIGSAPQSGAGMENGFQFTGQFSEGIRQLVAAGDMEFSIQNEQAYFAPRGEPSYTAPSFLISPETGLLDSPARIVAAKQTSGGSLLKPSKVKKKSQFAFRCLLNPQLVPGGRVQLESRQVKGVFRIDKIRHQGDNFGPQWVTECEVSQ